MRLRFAAFAFAPLLIAAVAAAPSSASPQRFAPRAFVTGGHRVVVDARHDVFAVRLPGNGADGRGGDDADHARAVVSTLLPKVVPGAVVKEAFTIVTAKKAGGGLVAVTSSVALDAAALDALAALVEADGGHLWPALTRPNTGVDNRAFADDRLVVTTEAGARDAVISAILEKSDGVVVKESRWLENTVVVAVGAAFDFDAVAASAALSSLPGVVSAEPNLYRELKTRATVNDPLFPLQWHLARNGTQNVPGDGTIHADLAWDISKGDPSVVVGIFDSGIEWEHPDLIDNVRQDLMFDTSDDGDTDPSPECQATQDGLAASPDCPNAQKPFREAHGTSVSGTVAARGDNGIGLAGVCPLCSLEPVRLLGEATNDALTIAEAFTRGCDPTGDKTGQGAWIINNSWGPGFSLFFPLSQSERDAFDLCRDVGRGGRGTVIVFAAGNETSNVAGDAYAKHPYIIGVAASSNLDDWASYSNFGEEIDVAAPSLGGTVQQDNFGIVTTDVPGGGEGYSLTGSGTDQSDIDVDYTDSFSGTSAASPVTSGLAGLILSVNPDLTAEQVRLVLTSTADKIVADKVDWPNVIGADIETIFAYDDNGHSIGFGYGRINAGNAVALAADDTALATDLGVAGIHCDPKSNDPGQCALCSDEHTCLNPCTTQDECADGTVCNVDKGACELPHVEPTDFMELCNDDCEYCVGTLNTEFEPQAVCSKECTTDDECDPRCVAGDPDCQTDSFDCRSLTGDPGGISICAQGSPNTGGAADFGACGFNVLTGTRVLVLSDDGKELCGENCFSDGPGDCPYGFHCGEAKCECTRQSGNGNCRELTCVETTPGGGDLSLCVVDPGHADVCAKDADCQNGDFCSLVDGVGTCRFDDRAGCDLCQACADSTECAGREACLGATDSALGVCTVACDDGEECPNGTTCRDVSFEIFQGRFAQVKACLGDAGDPADVETSPEAACGDFVCRVPECRADRPCDDGQVCDGGVCVDAPDGEGEGDSDVSGLRLSGGGLHCGGCNSGGDAAVSTLAVALLALLLRRRR